MPTSTAVHKSRRANGPRSNAQIRQGNAKRRLERSGGETGNRFLGVLLCSGDFRRVVEGYVVPDSLISLPCAAGDS